MDHYAELGCCFGDILYKIHSFEPSITFTQSKFYLGFLCYII